MKVACLKEYEAVCDTCSIIFTFSKHYGVNFPAKYCSRSCYYKARKGVRVSPATEMKKGNKKSKSISWKGGKTITKHGYVQVHKPEHPYSNQRGYVFEHRLVVEQSIGRYLMPGEVVHHKNHKTSDNRPDNLMLFASNSDHIRYEVEHDGRVAWNKGIKMGVI